MKRGALAGLALALLALLAFWLKADPVDQRAPVLAAALEPAAAALAVQPTQPTPPDLAPAAASAPPRPEPPAAAASSVAVELCGVGTLVLRVAPGASKPDTVPSYLTPGAVDAVRPTLFVALDAGSPRARAAAMMLRGTDAMGRDGSAALQLLAEQESDAVVVSWALARCASEPCRARMAQRWQQLEPDNAAPWLALMKGPPETAAQAWRAIAASARFQLHWGALAATVLESLPPGVLPYLQVVFVTEAIGIEAAFSLPDLSPLIAQCRARPPSGSQTQAACNAAARVLADHSDTMLVETVGLRLGEFAGWPAAEIASRRAANRLAQAAMPSFDADQPFSCGAIDSMRDWFSRVGKVGEVRALREAAAAASAPR